MKVKIYNLLTLFVMLFVQIIFAQEKTVTGKVTDGTNTQLAGVSVEIKGTKVGTQTDFDGGYTITAKTGQVLVFSYVGMKTQQIAVSGSTMNVKLQDDATMLEGIIVTAQGVKREKQAIGYATSQIKAKDIEQRSEGDVARILNGKASGVTINNTSGISGSATNITIRSLNSISGNTQPLFIVDGVPFSGATNSVGNFDNGNSGSSRFLDLDPNNIESVNILKGYAATTLYGTDGRNGVILITTKGGSNKKGSKKTEITVSQSLFFNEIASLPDYQNKFGNGTNQNYGNFFSNFGAGFYANGLGGYNNPGTNVASDGTILHPYSKPALINVFPQYQGQRIKYEAAPNNVKDFFRTGFVNNTNINLAGSSSDGSTTYNLNVGHLNDEGFTPGNKLNRTSISAGGKSKLSNKFTISGTMNFARTNFLTPPVARSNGSGVSGTGLSIYGDLFYTPRNVRLQEWPYQHPVTGANLSYRSGNDIVNPYWTLNNSFVRQITNRAYGSASLNYEINKNLNATYRVGYDFYNERNERGTNIGAPAGPLLGEYETFDNNNLIWDHNFILNGSYALSDKISFNFNAGATSRLENFDNQGVRSVNQQVYGILRHYNFGTQSPLQYTENRNVVGIYSQVDFDYDRYLYMTLSARKDWVSNTFNNTALYPSASLSFIPTKVFSALVSERGLNYLKLRAGLGTSAGFAPDYPVANTLGSNPRSFSTIAGVINPSQQVAALLGNANLRPELLQEIEFGFDSKFLNNRVTLDASYFKRKTKDLITETPIANSTGYRTTFTNIGLLEGYGIEVDLGLHIIKNDNKGFNWEINSNFFKGEMIVKDLGDLERVTIAGFTNLGNQAIEGEQLGVMVGTSILKDTNGNYLVNTLGNYEINNTNSIIGNPNPDFTANTTNSFSYRGINFSFLVSLVSGGDIYSQTVSTLLGRGLTTDTEDRLGSFILPGVKADGSTNNIQLNSFDYYFTNRLYGPNELQVFDGSVIRLNEVSLGYSLPKEWIERTPFGSLTFTLSGNNLYYNAYNTPKGTNFDPNVIGTGVGNGRGFDFLNGPSGKRYGFSLKATF